MMSRTHSVRVLLLYEITKFSIILDITYSAFHTSCSIVHNAKRFSGNFNYDGSSEEKLNIYSEADLGLLQHPRLSALG